MPGCDLHGLLPKHAPIKPVQHPTRNRQDEYRQRCRMSPWLSGWKWIGDVLGRVCLRLPDGVATPEHHRVAMWPSPTMLETRSGTPEHHRVACTNCCRCHCLSGIISYVKPIGVRRRNTPEVLERITAGKRSHRQNPTNLLREKHTPKSQRPGGRAARTPSGK